ncbi:MAG TPA: hypothetical protein VJC10_03920 [Patescibacteria group bacterium]|nr:hypothetical protein [Patescibacteria group bacterium]
MLTLHSVTQLVRTALKWGLIGFAVLVLLYVGIKIGSAIRNRVSPKASVAPTVTFGKLPSSIFPETIATQQFTYTIDTLSGKLPAFPDRISVYPIKQNKPTLLSLTRAKDKVAGIGFTSSSGAVLPEKKISETLYSWNSTSGIPRTLEMDIISYNFTLVSDFLSDNDVLNKQRVPTREQAKETATEFFNAIDTLPADINQEKTRAEYLTISNKSLVAASSLASAHVVRVDFFQNNIDNVPVVYPHPPFSTINVLLASGVRNPVIVEAHYLHQEIDTSKKDATYPIISASQAFEELKTGKAYIASYFGSSSAIALKDIYVGYYLSNNEQPYAYPVVVFEGDNGFVAYVSLIEDQWFGE